MSIRTIEHHAIQLVNESKILFPKSHINKLDLITYYQRIAPYLIPLIHNHPIAMNRFPDGIDQEGFYQKDIGDYFPNWIKRVAIKRIGDKHITRYVLCNDVATLVYLANQATITIHTWLSSASLLHHPDRMIFDLDPPDAPSAWQLLIDTAHDIKQQLETYELIPFVMTTGSKGLHIVVPLAQNQPFSTVKKFADTVAQQIWARNPEHITREVRKERREKKLFIDILRNQWAQLSVAPYSVRAREQAPIATPIAWHELSDPALTPQRYTINNIFKRLSHINNPWHNFFDCAQTIPLQKTHKQK